MEKRVRRPAHGPAPHPVRLLPDCPRRCPAQLSRRGARPGLDAQQRRHTVWEAFEACTALLYKVSICAPAYVVKPADDSFRRLRDLRDVVADGFGRDSDPYVAGRLRYDQAAQALRDAMRHDLGADT